MIENPAHLAYIILSPILSTAFAVLNVLTIYVFWRKFRIATLSLIVIVNICVCDIFVCLVSNTFYVGNILHPSSSWSTGPVSCKLFKFSTMLMNVSQIYLLCILNADRLRRLMDRAAKQWHKRQGIIFVGIAWALAALICVPRLILFDEEVEIKIFKDRNVTHVGSASCKPVGMDRKSYAIVTIVTFVVAYAIPACYIGYTLVRSQLFMWQRRKRIHLSTTANVVIKMHNKLSLTFNLVGALFMVIWTPFFVLSLIDLTSAMNNSVKSMNVNFSLRCTLLIIGSAKPFIYFICLDKFRNCLKFNAPSLKSESSTLSDKTKESKIDSPTQCVSHVAGISYV